MILNLSRSLRLVATGAGLLAGAIGWYARPAVAQSELAGQAAVETDRNSPAHTRSMDVHIIVNPDMTATVDSIVRLKILRESAIRTLGQQSLSFMESLNPLEIVEAYTEKADG